MDPEAISTFNQLREKYIMARRAKVQARASQTEDAPGLQNDEMIAALEKNVRHKKLILAELSRLPPDVVTYKNVGKAYLFTPKAAIVSQYEEAFKAEEERIQKGIADRVTYQKAHDSAEAEMAEYLSANQALAQSVMEAQS